MSHFIADDGAKIHVRVSGEGPPIVMLHGWTSSHHEWAPFLNDLNRRHRVYRWDARGHGGHPADNGDPPTAERMARDFANLLDHYGLGKVVAVGHSMGALNGWVLAAQRPDLVRGVVAWGVSGVISPEELASVERWLPVSAWGAERERWRQQIIERHGAEQLESMIEGWVGAARAISARGGNICYEQAARIECPVLLLNGDGEVGNTPRDARRLAERIPGGRLTFVADSGHAIHRDQPAALLGHIHDFLTKVEG